MEPVIAAILMILFSLYGIIFSGSVAKSWIKWKLFTWMEERDFLEARNLARFIFGVMLIAGVVGLITSLKNLSTS